MTPKEARIIIRERIAALKEEQVAAKTTLRQPHTDSTSLIMSDHNYRAIALSAYHNELNELCGRKPAHTYKEGYRSHYAANEHIKTIRAQIIWPEKPQVTA